MTSNKCPIVVLISGNGSNLQALIDASERSDYTISAVISNRPQAYGLERAARAGIATRVVDHTGFGNRDEFDIALRSAIDEYQPALVVLAGFMRLLGGDFVNYFAGRIINIHPSLLPKYPGTHTHQRAIEAGEKEHGVSVHFVTEEMDGGPVIAQQRVPVRADDTPEVLAARVLEKEHLLYPAVVNWFATGRLQMANNKALLDNAVLPPHGAEANQ
jgi:phosphoribosylglycinamide formyltransferase-1